MRVTIRNKNLELTPALSAHIEKKLLGPVKRLVKKAKESDLPIFELEIGRSTRHHKKGNVFFAEANLTLGSRVLRSSQEGEDIWVAIEGVMAELERVIKSSKARTVAIERRAGRKIKKQMRFDPASRAPEGARDLDEGN